MWNLDDTSKYLKVHSFTFNDVFTFGSCDDKGRREDIRKAAAKDFPKCINKDIKWWAFRISVRTPSGGIDVDNIPKIIIDAFCKKQIERDESEYPNVGLFEDDTIEFVKIVEVGVIQDQEVKEEEKLTKVEIFGYIGK